MGTYQYKRMPFGLRNAPAKIQRAIYKILSGVRWNICLVYLDYLITFSPSMDSHVGNVGNVLGFFHLVDVTLKLSKCSLFRNYVDYLGHTIMPLHLVASLENSPAIHKATVPNDSTMLC